MKPAACLFATLLAGCAAAPPPVTVLPDDEVSRLMARENVQGLGLAVIARGQVVSVKAYGQRNVERGLPLTPHTVMYGASLTKAAFAYMLLQLVDEGKLDLDASVATLLPQPLPAYTKPDDYADLAGDERWRKLTPRILLTHSTGFANFRWLEPDRKLRFHYDPGARYGYSGEGFYILQLIVERGLGLDTGKEMQRRVFDRFGMRNTSMQWRPDFAANLADGYTQEGKFVPHDERSRTSAAGSMDTTIDDQARLWAGVMRGEELSAASRAMMVKAQLPITSNNQFPTLLPGQVAWPQSLAAGLGVVTFRDRSGPAWFKGGHNDSTGNMVLCLERGQRCVVMLANDVRAERIYPELARRVLGDTDMPWQWEYGWYQP
ncbi:serine hydrolase domain-containing protein [Massilia yuzhufengensis]|uniref:CubicO group peptidase, beta-lactamase class C family n=1 Tax=Massilia yuzhufengensis TaxID=1164594 RepID=A0A1I1JSR1_9BURK|nr:serine hydrolase domain-containing protein [Massilia yuzhufengensis]SFC50992.1 CubicO group peptidase, beta-lactamase class C family [Massilia yuzhufengensis]